MIGAVRIVVTLAVTGHMDLTRTTVDLVRKALRRQLARFALAPSPLVGISCLARGADTLFAEAVLEAGGRLVVVLPSRNYRQAEVGPEHAVAFDRLTAVAVDVIVTPFATAGCEAYEAANVELLSRADALVAVWDGQPPLGRGGTGDMVRHAEAAGIEVLRVWPTGSQRASTAARSAKPGRPED